MTETYVERMKIIHDQVVKGVESDVVGRPDFAGLKLSHLGDEKLIDAPSVEKVKKELPVLKALEGQVRSQLVLSEGLVFNKHIFFKMLRHVGDFVVFRHLDKDGMTHSVGNIPNRNRIPAAGLWAWVVFLSVSSSLIWAVFSNFTTVDSQGFLTVLSIAFGGGGAVFGYWCYVELSPVRQLKLMKQEKIIKFLWPNGEDYARDEASHHISIRVKFPTEGRTPEVDDNIFRVIEAGKQIEATPFLVAHEKAIGIDLDSATLVRAANKDPFVCLETAENVIVFQNTLFGNVEEEAEMIKRLEESFASMRYHRLS